MGRSIPDRLRVTRAWTASYSPALRVTEGEVLTSHRCDPDNPGWRWTTNADGLGGWLPEGLVVAGLATRAFDSAELTVEIGQVLSELDRCNGWVLARTEAGNTGWIPESHVRPR